MHAHGDKIKLALAMLKGGKMNTTLSLKESSLKLEEKIADFFNNREKAGKYFIMLVEKSIDYLGKTTRFYLADLTSELEMMINLSENLKGLDIKNFDEEFINFLKRKNENFDRLCIEWGYRSKNHNSKSARSEMEILADAILSIRAALKIKDNNYTRNHMNNVTKYAEKIAKAMNLEEKDIETAKLTAYYHDIGKIIIPDSILTKPGKLNRVEFDAMKMHAQYGADILKVLLGENHKDIIFGVGNHHRKYSEIKDVDERKLLFCSIVSIADAFDAMTSDRPYRKNQGYDFALLELKKNSGSQFHPEIVNYVSKNNILA